MRILIVSDTHRRDENFDKVIDSVGKIDMVIHCGDTEGTERIMEQTAGVTFVAVKGNNDWFSFTRMEEELKLEGHKILVAHGHTYRVHTSNDRLVEEALSRDCDIVLYGHTHVPSLSEKNGVTVCNPGSLSYPRQANRKASYAIMNLVEGKKPEITIHYIDKDPWD